MTEGQGSGASPRIPWFLRSGWRLFGTLFLTLALPAAALTALVAVNVRSELRDHAVRQNALTARLVADAVGEEFRGLMTYLEAAAHRWEFAPPLAAAPAGAPEKYLQEIVSQNTKITRAFLADSKGIELFAYPHDPAVIGRDFSHRDWFKGASAAKGAYVSEFYRRASMGGEYVVAIAVRIHGPAGETVGYLVGQYTMKDLTLRIAAIRPASRGSVALLDQYGHLASSERRGQDPPDVSQDAVVREILARGEGWLQAPDPLTNEESLIGYESCAPTGWRVLARQPLEAVLAPILTLQRTIGLYFAACLAGMAALGYLWFRTLSRYEREREQAQRAVKESEEKYRLLFTQSRDAIYVNTVDGIFTDVNQAALDLFGYTREEVAGQRAQDLYLDLDQRNQLLREIARTGYVRDFEIRMRRKDGSVMDCLLNSSVRRTADGELAGYQGVVRDITGRKRAQRELEEKNRLLEEAVRAEREALNALKQTQSQLVQSEKLAGLGQMVAGVAHEINNPLSFVANNVSVLERDVGLLRDLLVLYREAESTIAREHPGVAERIGQIHDRVDLDYTIGNLNELIHRSREGLKRIQQIVRDLRDFARLDEGNLHQADLNASIESTVNIIRGHAAKKEIRIELELAPLPPVFCHSARINQVVMNLISNAVDASAAGSVVTVRTRPEAEGIRIEVADQGCGIDPAIHHRIFDPFFTTKPQGRGTGLGLSISYGIVRDHGGRIDIDSAPGRGSTFTVHLPRQPCSPADDLSSTSG